MQQIICEAIKKKLCLSIHYGGFDRVVEPHAYGLAKKTNREMVRVWQTKGGSRSNKQPPWRLMHVNEIHALQLLDEAALTPRQGYKRDDTALRVIFEQV